MNRPITLCEQITGILYGVGYNINYMIGEDAFNPDSIWILVQSPGIALMLHIVCGIISFLGSLIYIELGIRSLPSGIGEQKYITDALYPKKNVGHVFSFVAILLKLGTNRNNWNNIFNASFNFGAYGSGLIKVLLAYEGWNNINYLIGEFKPSSYNREYPSLILKYSSLISVGISFLLYFLTNAAFITVVGYNVNDSESIPIAMRFGKELLDGTGEKLMSILITISTFGCTSAMIFTFV
ncbi:13270_t:CDS:2 [Gigaspora margarita]|uniref:13270_t:CDS:1 n=1 Tax=Gigaspora margarita TaxID=4874 RepID=A0ABN7VMF7_GIGMA|nr:13270_t:CDS:2 [Gigaspora margarita]